MVIVESVGFIRRNMCVGGWERRGEGLPAGARFVVSKYRNKTVL